MSIVPTTLIGIPTDNSASEIKVPCIAHSPTPDTGVCHCNGHSLTSVSYLIHIRAETTMESINSGRIAIIVKEPETPADNLGGHLIMQFRFDIGSNI